MKINRLPKRQARRQKFPNLTPAEVEMVLYGGQLIPVLGTVGGSAEQARETAKNIERHMARKS